MEKGPVTGFMADFSQYALHPLPLPKTVPPGISIQALETFSVDLIDLKHHRITREDPLIQELGIPPDAILYRSTLDRPAGWEDVRLEITGLLAEEPIPPNVCVWTDLLCREEPTDEEPGGEPQPLRIFAWCRRVVCTAVPALYFDIRWHPKRGVTKNKSWPDHISEKVADAFQHKAVQLLLDGEKRGRPRGPRGFKDAQAFEEELIEVIRTVANAGRNTSQHEIAIWWRPSLDKRWGDTQSAASVDMDTKDKVDSTTRLIRKHITRPWDDLVHDALHSR